MVVGLKSWRSREWSCSLEQRSGKIRVQQLVELGRDDRVNLIGSGNLPFSNC